MSTVTLSRNHGLNLTIGSAISQSVIESRQYRTITEKELPELERLGFARTQIKTGMLIPVWHVTGQVATYQLKPDQPRTNDEGKPVKYETMFGTKMVIDVHPSIRPQLSDPSIPLWITEGVKKGDSAVSHGLCCVALLGVWNFLTTNAKGGKTALPDFEMIALNGRTVYIAFDSDYAQNPKVTDAMIRLGNVLELWKAKVRYVLIPSEDGQKVGLDDWFVQGGTAQTLIDKHVHYEAPKPVIKERKPTQGADLPTIQVNNRELREVLTDALKAIDKSNDPPRLFDRSGRMARIILNENGGTAEVLGSAETRYELGQVANWIKVSDRKTHVFPPAEIADMLLASRLLPPSIKPLRGLSTAPVLGPSGDFLTSHGYDAESGWYITGHGPWREWDGDGESAARWMLDEVLADFPFEDEASAANALAMFVLPMVRSLVDSATPLHLVDAPASRSGKSLLISTLLTPFFGDIPVTGTPKDEPEMEKKLFTLLREGAPVIFFDNFRGKLASASLEACLTASLFRSRILGGNTSETVPVNSMFCLTSNQAELNMDVAQRTVWIRLDPKTSAPEDRQGFKQANLRKWTKQHGPEIVSAGMGMVREWVRQGRPDGSRRKSTALDWSLMVGGILETCNVRGFLANDKALKEKSDTNGGEWSTFMAFWYQRWKTDYVGIREVAEEAHSHGHCAGVFARSKDASGRQLALSRAISRRCGLVVDGMTFRKRPHRHNGYDLYQIQWVEGSEPIPQPTFDMTSDPNDPFADENYDPYAEA